MLGGEEGEEVVGWLGRHCGLGWSGLVVGMGRLVTGLFYLLLLDRFNSEAGRVDCLVRIGREER